MRRREFIAGLGGAAAWPVVARAQQPKPVVGFIHPSSPEAVGGRLRAFNRGLKEAGFVEGENVTIEYRWAENQVERLPTLAADLARRRVAVIATSTGSDVALAAKAATKTIPIVFLVSGDPVGYGLVASLARPGGNLTGVNFFNAELNAKRLEFLHQLVPTATRIAVLLDPNTPVAVGTLRDVETVARAAALQVQVHRVTTAPEIDAAFAAMATNRPDALFVSGGPLFNARRLQLAMLAVRHGIPAAFASRDYTESGGLMSYGTDVSDGYRQMGVYAGRVLKGAKPADMPVVQSSKFELVINQQTARTLGITVPQALLVAADAIIE